jgi:hypothetical protein
LERWWLGKNQGDYVYVWRWYVWDASARRCGHGERWEYEWQWSETQTNVPGTRDPVDRPQAEMGWEKVKKDEGREKKKAGPKARAVVCGLR